MDRLISCEFNMDTACVELKFASGSMIVILYRLVGRKYPLFRTVLIKSGPTFRRNL